MHLLFAVLMLFLPQRLKHEFARRVLGWEIHPTAYIGMSLIAVRKLVMGPGTVIGPRNVIRTLEELVMEEGSSIATRNWIIGLPLGLEVFARSPRRYPCLILRRHAMITDAHEIDCCDRVEIGEYASFAGFRSQIMTHSLNLFRDQFECAPVEIGARSSVMSNCILLMGSRVPARSVVSAGSVVNTKLTKELTFYRGNPAVAVRELPERMQFFQRGTPGHHAYAAGDEAATKAETL